MSDCGAIEQRSTQRDGTWPTPAKPFLPSTISTVDLAIALAISAIGLVYAACGPPFFSGSPFQLMFSAEYLSERDRRMEESSQVSKNGECRRDSTKSWTEQKRVRSFTSASTAFSTILVDVAWSISVICALGIVQVLYET